MMTASRTRTISWIAAVLAAGALSACGGDAPPDPADPPVLRDPEGNIFSFINPGDLVAGSGTGVTDDEVFAPNMRYPIEEAPSYSNSQVWGVGGLNGPPGDGQCDARNYTYPWRDNFCETRGFSTPLCPEGTGHQGQDIRPATCEDAVHWAVAAESGQITGIGSFSVTLAADSGTIYRYLHLEMDELAVAQGDTVVRGQRLGLVSDDFGGTLTTIHLHFDMRQAVALPDGRVSLTFVPPYASLIEAYERLLRGED